METRQRNQRRASVGEKAVDVIRGAERKVEHALTCMWDDLQSWQQDNQYILSGYRPATASFKKSFISLSYFHNESINIYTHLIGALAFFLISIYLYNAIPPRYPTSTRADIIVFATFFLSAATCLGMSATYHTISNHSHSVAKFGNQLDYLGIIILIVGSYLPTTYYGFSCHPSLTWSYFSMIVVLGLLSAIITLLPTFRTPTWRPFRAGMFVALGSSGAIPVLHGISVYGFSVLDKRMGLRWVLLEGALYALGAGIYAARLPEKLCPGRFDLVGASHQVFHCLVVVAALAHLKGLMMAFDFLHSRGAIC